MNKAKIIFGVIGVFLLALIIWGVMLLNKQTDTATNPKTTGAKTASIWIMTDKKEKFKDIIDAFKSEYKQYAGTQIDVESFSSYQDYYTTLMASFIAGKSPDVFVLNNNEQSIFLEQVEGLDPAAFNPNDFRKKYLPFFGDDLIKNTTVKTDKGETPVEFVIGVPVGYETLGVFYNRKKGIQAKDVESWASVNSIASKIKKEGESFVPVGLGNGSTIPFAEDISTQFMMLDDIVSLQTAEGNKLKQALASYMVFGNEDGDNAYNALVPQLKLENKNVLYNFSRDEVGMVFGYPRLIEDINASGFRKSFLGAAPFPNYFLSSGKTLVNYNYFVVNRNSRSLSFAKDFVAYMASEKGQKKYLETYTYYLPSLISLETDFLEQKIHPDYNITLKDFLRTDNVKSSFDKGMKGLYDQQMLGILDDSKSYESLFANLKKRVLCQTEKTLKLTNLSSSCD